MNNVLKDFSNSVNCLDTKYLKALKSNLSNMLNNLEFKNDNTDNMDSFLNSKKLMLTKIMLIDQKLLDLSKG